MKKVPRLRFRGFQDDWEHRKLDDSIKVMDGDRGANYPHDTDFFKDGDTLFLDTGNVTKNGFKFDSVKYITNEKDEQLRAGKLEKNDFVLTSRGTLGNVGFYDEVVYNLHPKIRINSAMLILRNTDEQLSYSYLHTLLKGQLISDFMKKNQVGSAQPHITKSEFLKLNLNVPCNINEQNKIGNFFKSLDVTITLHQRKLEQLKELKKAYLQVMFPEKDERVPKLRFADFEEEWELCKLGKLAEFNPKSNLPEKFEYVDLESVVGTELVGHRLENRDSAPSRAQRLAKKNDVFYQTVRPYQKNNYLFDLPYDNYVFSTGYAQMRPSGNGYFLLTLVQEEKFVNRVLERSTGTSYPAISSNDLAKLSVRVPADIEEEQNIGKFFSNLDNLVTLHQNKLTQLKSLKKSYLQNMFI
ncbi:restriction endonuclease subunit S [Enterococcus sp. C81]|nr:restriction endonuclease subunit S [Enterococcus faecalis]MEB7790934.1 restriction endonuclease subunit S [Enterococcus faecalis]MEB7809103.1 restriction endonuclease subunit S [Enterococcus faecalis]